MENTRAISYHGNRQIFERLKSFHQEQQIVNVFSIRKTQITISMPPITNDEML